MIIGVAVIVVCAALVAAGVVIVVRWGAGAPAPASADTARRAPARPARHVAVAFFAFAGVAAGTLSALLYVLVGSLLPRGRAGGVALGLLLLVLAGARIEPLRADNFDFNLLGPGWLSLLSFTALGVFQGMVMWALAGGLNLHPLPVGRSLGGRRAVTAGRVAAGVLVLVALPGFVSAVSDILTFG